MTTSMIAWHRTMRTPATTSTEHRAHSLSQRSLVFIRTHMHRGSSLTSLRHSPHPHVHGHPCGLFTLILLFYFLLYLPHFFLFLNYLKSVVNLHNSCDESMDSTDEFSLSTGYEPKAPRLLRDLSRARAAPGLAAALLQQSLFCGPRLR